MRKRILFTGSMLALLLSAAAFAQSGQSGSPQAAQGTQSSQTDQNQAGAAPAAEAANAQAGAAGAQEPAAAQGTPASEPAPAPASGAQQGTGAESGQGPAATPTAPGSKAPAGGASGATPSSVLAATDKTFIRDAALGSLEAEELGRLAAEKASNPDVKAFGQKMADDHKQAADTLKQIGSSLQYEPPSRPSSHAKSDKARLEKLSGADFDREFLSLVVKEHQKDLSVFEKESKREAAPASLKSFAASTLKGLQDHLKMAQDLSGKLGTGSNSPGSPGSSQHP